MAKSAFSQLGYPPSADGWVDATSEVWTYLTASTFTVPGDQTVKFQKGTRLKFTQTSVKYAVVIGSSYSAGTTTVTIAVNTDYTIANAAISANYYSYQASPQGYPGWFSYTPTTTGFSGSPTVNGQFNIIGNICYFQTTCSGTSNSAALTFTLPVPAANTVFGFWTIMTQNAGGAYNIGRAYPSSTTVVTCGPNGSNDTWTASGTKTAEVDQFYRI